MHICIRKCYRPSVPSVATAHAVATAPADYSPQSRLGSGSWALLLQPFLASAMSGWAGGGVLGNTVGYREMLMFHQHLTAVFLRDHDKPCRPSRIYSIQIWKTPRTSSTRIPFS